MPDMIEALSKKWARKLGERLLASMCTDETKTLWSEDMARVAIANALEDAINRVETCVCEDTGRQAVQGECPVHHGDACMFDVSQMRKYVNGSTYLQGDVANMTRALESIVADEGGSGLAELAGQAPSRNPGAGDARRMASTAREALNRLRKSQRDRKLT